MYMNFVVFWIASTVILMCVRISARTLPMGKGLTLLIINKQPIKRNTVPDDVYSLENQLAEPVKIPIGRCLVQLVSQVIRTSEGFN